MLSTVSRLAAALCLIGVQFGAAPLQAAASDATRRDTPSGLPVPRFVSLRFSETNCRSGPSLGHPVSIRFLRAGEPVLVVAETLDHWRRLRDADGSECWAHQRTLAARSHVLVLRETTLRAAPSDAAASKARLAPGLLAEFDGEERNFAKVRAAGVSGWADVSALWGVDIAARN